MNKPDSQSEIKISKNYHDLTKNKTQQYLVKTASSYKNNQDLGIKTIIHTRTIMIQAEKQQYLFKNNNSQKNNQDLGRKTTIHRTKIKIQAAK